MPRGSKIGERRGGRQRGTPNRRTVLIDRILALAAERPSLSAIQLIDILAADHEVPADIRIAIARKLLRSSLRSVGCQTAKSSSGEEKNAKPADPRPERSGVVKPTGLNILLGVAIDNNAHPRLRRKAAAEIAQILQPRKPGAKRWWPTAPVDEYGFSITPQVAAEYRDTKMELRRLGRSGANRPAAMRKAGRLRDRLNAILQRLQCPCPSIYGVNQLGKDLDRLIYFLQERDAKATLSTKENAEDAHLRARSDSFFEGPESAARHRLSLLRNKERMLRTRQGPQLSWKDQVDLRLLQLLYPPPSRSRSDLDDNLYELHYELLRHAAFAKDGNLYPPNSKLRPSNGENIVEELIDNLDCTCGNHHPDHTSSCEPAAPPT